LLVRSRQWFSPALFQGLAADASVDGTITLEAPLAADAATLRLIQHGLKADTHRVEINGHALELPSLAGVICDLPVDPAWLAAENQIRVGALAGAGKAQIASLSLFLHTRSPSP